MAIVIALLDVFTALIFHYCDTYLRKLKDFPFPFSDRLSTAFGSLSSPERMESRTVRVRSDQRTTPERSRSDSGAILDH